VAVLFIVLVAGLLTTFLTGRTSYLSADAYIQVQQEGRRAFDTMVRELRESGQVTVTADGVNGSSRLHFQIARGYNTEAGAPPLGCTVPPSICWGSDTTTGEWVHYSLIGAAGNTRQLIRYRGVQGAAPPASCTAANDCRVLANYIRHPNEDNTALFLYDAATQTVTVNLQTELLNPVLPTGRITSPLLTSRVRLRN
jgi:Tfp pilus assembly protein PilW